MTPMDEDIESRGSDDQGRCMEDVCDADHAALYKSVAARLNYMSPDRPDMQYDIKEICRRMADPTWRDLARLKRMGRYFIGRPRLIIKYKFQGAMGEHKVRVLSDANWAGCKSTRKSTSGGCIYIGNHCVKIWSKIQHCISTPSAESEGVAMVKAVSEGLCIARILEEFDGVDVRIEVMADANAALEIIEREGVGKVRHVDVGILWIQQKLLKKIVGFHKLPGTENTADMMTKALNREKGDQFVRDMNGEFRQGRAGKAVRLQGEIS